MIAPIILFTYNRLDHTKQTIEALQKNKLAGESDLFIFSDGPKDEQTKESIQNLRAYLHTIMGFKNVQVTERDKNYGLASNIIDGVTKIVNKYGHAIILEDDIVVSPYFLEYMNDGLNVYKDQEKVICIHGYLYPIKEHPQENFFLRGADCWGWATWKRGWDIFEPNGQTLLDYILKNKLSHEFDFDGSYPFTKMLSDQIKGKNNSWAIRWQASAFIKNKLTLYPKRSMAMNIGNDGSGIHCNVSDEFDVLLSREPIPVKSIPLEVNKMARESFIRYFFSIKPGLLTKARFKLKKIFQ
jgi:hypothetical protein